MCMSKPKVETPKIVEQLNKNNVVLSNEKTASTTKEKQNTKRTMGSLRIPYKGVTDTLTGVNTTDTTTGLNIPI